MSMRTTCGNSLSISSIACTPSSTMRTLPKCIFLTRAWYTSCSRLRKDDISLCIQSVICIELAAYALSSAINIDTSCRLSTSCNDAASSEAASRALRPSSVLLRPRTLFRSGRLCFGRGTARRTVVPTPRVDSRETVPPISSVSCSMCDASA